MPKEPPYEHPQLRSCDVKHRRLDIIPDFDETFFKSLPKRIMIATDMWRHNANAMAAGRKRTQTKQSERGSIAGAHSLQLSPPKDPKNNADS